MFHNPWKPQNGTTLLSPNTHLQDRTPEILGAVHDLIKISIIWDLKFYFLQIYGSMFIKNFPKIWGLEDQNNFSIFMSMRKTSLPSCGRIHWKMYIKFSRSYICMQDCGSYICVTLTLPFYGNRLISFVKKKNQWRGRWLKRQSKERSKHLWMDKGTHRI